MPISRKFWTWAVATAIIAVLVVFVGPSIIGPESIVGSKNVLTTAKMIPLPVDGPESLDWDPRGEGPYVGVTDGRILKWRGSDLGWVEFAYSSPHRDVFFAFLCGEKTGRAIRYDKKSKEAKVIMDRLHFPNGLAISKDGSFVLSCEVPTQLVHRYWAKGPKSGTRDVFAKLPGYADNIRRTEKGDFWVALHSKRTPFSRFSLMHPWIGKFFMKTLKMDLLVFLFEGGKPHAVAVKLCGKTGKVLEVLEDSEGKNMKFISEVQERDGKLWFGSVFLPSVWVLEHQ
ncbi:hypothetical protein YC2023_028581 [Brassica napus]